MNISITKKGMINLRNLLVLAFLALIVALLLLFYANNFKTAFHNVMSVVDQHTLALRLTRWSIIVLFVFAWPHAVNIVGKSSNMTDKQLLYWRSAVYRIAIWLVLFELLVGENIIYKLFHLF